MGPSKNYNQEELKSLRVQIDACIQVIESEQENGHEGVEIKNHQLHSMASYQAEIKLREAKMWIGKMMEGMGSELPVEFRDQAPKA